MIKKFTTFLLAFAIVLSISTPKSSAAGGAIVTVVGSIAKSTLAAVTTELVLRAAQNGLENYFSKPQTKEFVENLIAEGIFTVADYIAAGFTDQDIYDQFTDYNAQLETDLGTTTLFDGGVRVLFPLNPSSIVANGYANVTQLSVNSPYLVGSVTFSNSSGTFRVSEVEIIAPFTCSVTRGITGTITNAKYDGSFTTSNVNQGDTIGFVGSSDGWRFFDPVSSSYPVVSSFNCAFYADLVPATGVVLPTGLDISTPSRPTSLITPIAIQNPDDTYTVYNNITLVDEGNKVVFNPATGEAITFTDWVYDYESRTYDLTLDGGGNMTVQFGNDSITMTQGDTVTNIFYVQDPADDPGTDNPDDPDNPGTDADVSGFFAWWKNAWNGFVDRLFTALDGGDLEVILPGEEGNPEDEEDDGWTVFDLFALIRDALWKIITGVITVVLDGFLGLVDAIASLGDFFDIYDPANPDGIFGVPNGGVDLWS